MSFDPTKPVMPICGGEAIIHSTSGPYITNTGVRMPIVASFKTLDGLWDVSWFRADGGYCGDNSSHRFDLINIPEEKWRPFELGEVTGPVLVRRKNHPLEWVMATGRINGLLKIGVVKSDLSDEDKKVIDDMRLPKPETHEVSFDLGKTWQPAGVKIQ